jgi:hypothetical protein
MANKLTDDQTGITDDQIRSLHNGYRDGTMNDAIGRHLCKIALAERCIKDESVLIFRYPTAHEREQARLRLAAALAIRHGDLERAEKISELVEVYR